MLCGRDSFREDALDTGWFPGDSSLGQSPKGRLANAASLSAMPRVNSRAGSHRLGYPA
jgi:hypothetical protein